MQRDQRVVEAYLGRRADAAPAATLGKAAAVGSDLDERPSPRPPSSRPGRPHPAPPLLHVAAVHTYYGSIHALRGISLTVWPGEMVTLIGSNGAGKSTTLKTISGFLRPARGRSCWTAGASTAGRPTGSSGSGSRKSQRGGASSPA